MSCSSLCGADKIGHSWPVEFEVYTFYCFEALASFHHGSLSIRLTAATPTRGEILVQLGTLSRKPRSAKRKKSSSTEKDRPVSVKVQKLGASPTSLARKPERAQSPAAEAPMVTSSPPPSKPAVKAKNLLGGSVEQPLAIMPITVWNPPSKSARPPPRRVEELKRKKSGIKNWRR